MPRIVEPAVDAYLEAILPRPSAPFRAMERAGASGELPLIDRQVGRLLELLVALTGARRILEIGTCIGYSTAWLARAAGARGRVTSIELDPERAALARKNLARARLAGRVEVVEGDTARVLPGLRGPYDLVFNDGAKVHYPLVARLARRLLRKGGLLVSDNALWSGRVAHDGGDADTRAIRRHNAALVRDPLFLASILPLRDGVLVARRV